MAATDYTHIIISTDERQNLRDAVSITYSK